MKRDMDLIRQMVLELASEDSDGLDSMDGVSDKKFAYHARLLHEAGLAVAAIHESLGDDDEAYILRLTWDGHEFADAIQEDTLWKKAKENVIKPATGWTFGILTAYLKAEITRQLPGLDIGR